MSLTSKLRQLREAAADPRWWPFYLQRRFMRRALRGSISAFIAKSMRPPAAPAAPSGSGTGASPEQAQAQSLLADGIVHLGQLLSTSEAAELCAYFLTKPARDPYRPSHPSFLPDSQARHAHSHVGYHEDRDVVLAPGLLALANRPAILAIVEGFLGCKPTLGYLAAWWSYPTAQGAQEAERFHRDVDDWRFVKLFIYLTDVGPGNGPHVYVRCSSASAKLRQIGRFEDAEVFGAFGADNVIEVTAPAGQGFLEDTFGFHKGKPVEQGRRLIFQAVYSLFSLPYGPKKQVARLDEIEGLRPDPWINRLYLN